MNSKIFLKSKLLNFFISTFIRKWPFIQIYRNQIYRGAHKEWDFTSVSYNQRNGIKLIFLETIKRKERAKPSKEYNQSRGITNQGA